MKHKIDKQQIINEFIKLLENEDIKIIRVDIENESEDFYGDPSRYIENVLTGYSKIEISLLNRKVNENYIMKRASAKY